MSSQYRVCLGALLNPRSASVQKEITMNRCESQNILRMCVRLGDELTDPCWSRSVSTFCEVNLIGRPLIFLFTSSK